MAALQGAVWFPLFTASSVAMVVLNKYCAAAFPLPYSLLLFQNAVTVALNAAFVQVPRRRARVCECACMGACMCACEWVSANAWVRPHGGQPRPAARSTVRVRVHVECHKNAALAALSTMPACYCSTHA